MFLAPLKDKYFENIILENILYVKIAGEIFRNIIQYCRTHNVRVCLYIAYIYIACGSASLYIKMLYFILNVLALSTAATVANIKIRYDAKTPQFAIFGTSVICVFYSVQLYSNICGFHFEPFFKV